MSNLFHLPQRRRLAQTHFCGVLTSLIMVITGKLMKPGKVFCRVQIDTVHDAFRVDVAPHGHSTGRGGSTRRSVNELKRAWA